MPQPASPLVEEVSQVDAPVYTDEETKYISGIMARLVRAKMERDQAHPEFNNKTYIQNYEDNERIANTFVPEKKFDGDVKIASGTVEQKLETVLSEINRLNLSPEALAFDQDKFQLVTLGRALTDTIFQTRMQEYETLSDDEFKLMRQRELLKQGHVFIQENWVREFKKQGTIAKKFIGKVTDVEITKKLVKVFEGPRSQILYGPGVYLGNIREFTVRNQPFLFTYKLTSYDEAKTRYGMKDKDGNDVWERWKHVPHKRVQIVNIDNVDSITVNKGFALADLESDMVEEIHYQDRFNDEYQIFLNGVAMLPVGFPLSAMSPGGEYNIEKQVLHVINPFFAYGRSFCSKVVEQSELFDELLRLLMLKTRKSIHPAYANISNRVISARALMPGRITMGIDPGALQRIGEEGQGATASEYQMLELLQQKIDSNTVSPQMAGQQGKSGTTALEVATLARQAQKVISLIVFACSSLEQKMAYLRLYNILANYYSPIDTRVDEVRGEIRKKYRNTSRKTNIEGRGMGLRQVIPTEDEMPNAEEIMDMEDFYGTPEPMGDMRRKTRDELGMPPIEIIYLNPEEVKKAKICWYIEIDSKEKDTSNMAKLMFREELNDIAALTKFGSVPNTSELEERYALIWNRRKDKLFKTDAAMQQMSMMPGGMEGKGIDLGMGNMAGSPNIGASVAPTES